MWSTTSGDTTWVSPACGAAQAIAERQAAEPREMAEFRDALKSRDPRVSFGKLDRGKLGLAERLVTSLPAFPGLGRRRPRLESHCGLGRAHRQGTDLHAEDRDATP